MSAPIVLRSELYSKKNGVFGFLGWGEIISLVTRNDSHLPKGVELSLGEQVRTGPEPVTASALGSEDKG